MSAVTRNILAVRNDRFGEFLLNIPAFRVLKQPAPGTRLTVAVAEAVAPLARAVPFIDEVMVWPPMPWKVKQKIAIALDLRRRKFDAAVILNPSAGAHEVIFGAGIRRRVGWFRKHGILLTDAIEDDKASGKRHEVESNLSLVALFGRLTMDRSLTLDLAPEVLAAAEGLAPAGAVAVHPWTSDAVKQWSLERFRELVERLAAVHPVVIIGRPETWHAPFDVSGIANVTDLTGRTTLLEAAAVLKKSAALISCDSGPVHLAASVGTPVVVLFRNDIPGKNPERWGPWDVKSVILQRERLEIGRAHV